MENTLRKDAPAPEGSSGFRIRFARLADIPRIVDLMRSYNMHDVGSPEIGPIDDRRFVVAERKGELAGAAGFAFGSAEVGETTLMAVRPEFTGMGIGLALQTRRMQVLRSLGCSTVITYADRPETIAWYKRHFGYRETGRLPKSHAVGNADAAEWTTLEADLAGVEMPSAGRSRLLINAAITGMKPRKSDNPNLPVTPSEIAAAAVEAGRLGAAVIHLHARGSDGAPTPDPSVYAEIIRRIREVDPDLILCVTTSGRNWQELEKRSAVLELDGDAKPDMASLTPGSMNFPGEVSANHPGVIRALAGMMLERGIKPELEIFEVGMIDYAKYLLRHGILRLPACFNLFLGSLGTMNATLGHFGYMVSQLPQFSTWAASGIGGFHARVQEWAVKTGGGVRTGLEDSPVTGQDGRAPGSNADWIRRALDLAAACGREPATPSEVRQWLEIEKP